MFTRLLSSQFYRNRFSLDISMMHTSNSCYNLCSVLRQCLVEEPDIEKIEEQTIAVRCVDEDPDMTITTKILGVSKHYQRKKSDTLKNTLKRMHINLTYPHNGKRKLKKVRNSAASEVEKQYYPDDINIEVQQLNSHEKVSVDMEMSNKDAWKEHNVLMIGDVEFKIRVNAPTVLAIDVPKHIMVGFPVVPNVEIEFGEREEAKFMWFKGRVNNEVKDKASSAKGKNKPFLPSGKCCESNIAWEFLTNTFKYTPNVSDIGYKLKFICIPRRQDVFGFSQEVISDKMIEAGPGPCPFEERHLYTLKQTEGPRALRIVSYNILADIYADTEFARENMYPYCSRYAITFDYRGQLILKEIIGYNADILCLQECDLKVFHNFLQPAMREEGLQGAFLRKSGEMPEGEAIFYRGSRFTEIKKSDVIISEALYFDCNEDILNVLVEHPNILESLKKRTAVGQIIALEDSSKDRILCIMNTHLYFRPTATIIRLLQMAVLINHLQAFIDDIKEKLSDKKESKIKISPIICGDFNSTPDQAVMEFITSGKIDKNHLIWRQQETERDEFGLDLRHEFNFFSACGYPDFTNYVMGFKGTLDYIVPDSRDFKVESYIPLPDEEILKLHTALPSVTVPSDHLALICDLVWN